MLKVKKRIVRRAVASALTTLSGFLCGSSTVQAAPLNITYSLATTSKVSLNIYDSNGQIVRELLHTAARTSEHV